MMVKTIPQQKQRERLWTFALVFKSRDKNILTQVEDFVFSRGGIVIYKTGPTSYHLFVIKAGGKPEVGQEDDAGGKK
jgi:hypothetical protein